MYKKIIGFLTVLFLAFNVSTLAVADTIYRPDTAGSCSGDAFLAALAGDTSVQMTPIFQKNCVPGEEQDGYESCKTIYKVCPAGHYLDLSGTQPSCKPCGSDYWCPLTFMSIETPNTDICGAGYVDSNAYDRDNKPNGTIGRCKCPERRQTYPSDNANAIATDISQCSYYNIKPGHQLERTGDETNGYTYTETLCEEDHYCAGGVFTAADYYKTMKACPDKYTGITTEEDCDAFRNAMAVDSRNDVVWNANADDDHKCIIKGRAEIDTVNNIGSFRCSYACPAGYMMRVTGGIQTGGWVNFYSTCEICSVGNYCTGGTFFMETKYDETTYNTEKSKYIDNNTTYGDESCSAHIPGTTTIGTGATSADQCVAQCSPGWYYNAKVGECLPCTTTTRSGYTQETCEAVPGFVWENNACVDKNIKELSYCPGGSHAAYDNETNSNVGIYECAQYNITDYNNNPIYSVVQEHTEPYISKPTEDKKGCRCPGNLDGGAETYKWNPDTLACCASNQVCCGPGYKLRSYAGGGYECLLCKNERTAPCECPEGYSKSGSECVNNNDATDTTACVCPATTTWGVEIDETTNEHVLKCIYNDVFCTGITIQTECSVPRDPITNAVIGYKTGRTSCHTCVAGAVPATDRDGNYVGCTCDAQKMQEHPEEYVEQPAAPANPLNVRYWSSGNRCELNGYSVRIYYTDVDQTGYYYSHGGSSGYAYKTYNYNYMKHITDKTSKEACEAANYKWAANSNKCYSLDSAFDIDWHPSQTSYKFTPNTGTDASENGGYPTSTGYVFAGWCREKTFCCPYGYKVYDLAGGKKECRTCSAQEMETGTDDEKVACSGRYYSEPSATIRIDPVNNASDRSSGITYNAMLVYEKTCAAGYYLNGSSCAPCPAGYWCPGGAVSPHKPGKNACDSGTYNPETMRSSSTDCIRCDTAVAQELGIVIPASNGLTTQTSASTSITQCGYYCSAGKYDNASDNRFKCDATCVAGSYCPGGGLASYGGYYRQFYRYDDRGKGMLDCPNGLTSDAGATNCYKDVCPAKTYVKYENGKYDCAQCEEHVGCTDGKEECFNKYDQSISNITTETECLTLGYTWNSDSSDCFDGNKSVLNITTETQCAALGDDYKWANITGCRTYYYCTGGNKIQISLIPWGKQNHITSPTKLGVCGTGKMALPAPASQCQDSYNAGWYQRADGTQDICRAGSYCPSSDSAAEKCPAGSVSKEGAAWIYDCKCLSDVDLETGVSPRYRPAGVYAEKGAELVLNEGTGKYVCVNTYLVLDDTTEFESAVSNNNAMPDAGARIVSCEWVSDPNVSEDEQQVTGTYKKCTSKALSFCHPATWDPGLSATDNDSVTELYLAKLASEFGGTNGTVRALLNNMTPVNDVKAISQIAGSDTCESVVESWRIQYLGLENAEFDDREIYSYSESSLPLWLNNPSLANYDFAGWCKYDNVDDAYLFEDTCTEPCTEEVVNNCVVEKQGVSEALNEAFNMDVAAYTYTDQIVSAVSSGETGVRLFYAQWTPIEYDVVYNTIKGNDGVWTVGTDLRPIKYTVESTAEQRTLPDATVMTREGYTFTGWCNGAETCGETIGAIAEGATGEQTLYAQWTPHTTTVTYSCDGVDKEPDTVDYNAAYAWKTNNICDSVEGYSFSDFTCAKDETSVATEDVEHWNIDGGTVACTATKTPHTYTIVFDKNDADGSQTMDNQSMTYDEADNLSENAYTNTGYSFAGWCKGGFDSTTGACTGDTYADGAEVQNLTAEENGEVTLYAQWTPHTYTITFVPDGGTCVTKDGVEGTVCDNKTYTIETDTFDLPTADEITRDNYRFNGWCLPLDIETIEQCADNNSIRVTTDPVTGEETSVLIRTVSKGTTGNLNFTAQWLSTVCPMGYGNRDDETDLTDLTKCYARVVFNANGGTPEPGIIKKYYNNQDKYTLAAEEIPEVAQEGYEFDYWYDSDNNSVSIETEFVGDNTLTAHWTPHTYTIVFDKNGADGSQTMDDQSMTYGESANLSDNAYTNTGYSFAGWCKGSFDLTTGACTGDTYDNGAEVQNLTADKDGEVTLYAIWMQNPTTVKYFCGATETTPAEVDAVNYDAAYAWKTNSICSEEGYSFSDFTCAKDETSVATEDVEHWNIDGGTVICISAKTANVCTVTFDGNGATGTMDSQSFTCGEAQELNEQTYTAPADYAFAGWCNGTVNATTGACSGMVYQNKASITITSDITLYAMWTPVCTDGKRLHVGTGDMCVYKNKHTSPSLAIKFGEHDVYYGNMTLKDTANKTMSSTTNNKLHIMYNSKLYNVHDLTATIATE